MRYSMYRDFNKGDLELTRIPKEEIYEIAKHDFANQLSSLIVTKTKLADVDFGERDNDMPFIRKTAECYVLTKDQVDLIKSSLRILHTYGGFAAKEIIMDIINEIENK